MIYNLEFKKNALKEWNKLGATLKSQFKKKLIERLSTPHIPAARLSGAKLRQSGYRLVYQVEDNIVTVTVTVTVLAVGKRERNDVYKKTTKRLDD